MDLHSVQGRRAQLLELACQVREQCVFSEHVRRSGLAHPAQGRLEPFHLTPMLRVLIHGRVRITAVLFPCVRLGLTIPREDIRTLDTRELVDVVADVGDEARGRGRVGAQLGKSEEGRGLAAQVAELTGGRDARGKGLVEAGLQGG